MAISAVAVVLLSALLAAGPAAAQASYPEQAIRILVGFPPGGPPDIAARLLGEKFAEAWGRAVVVENATGSGGNVAVERVTKAAPDGYTLLMANSAIAINPSLSTSCPTTRSRTWRRSRSRWSRRSSSSFTPTCRPAAWASSSRSRVRGPAR